MCFSPDPVCRRSNSRRRRGAARAADFDRTPSCWRSAGPSWRRDRALRTSARGGSSHRKTRSRQRCRAAGRAAPDSHRVGSVAIPARSSGPMLIGSSRTFLMAVSHAPMIFRPSVSTQTGRATSHLARRRTESGGGPGVEPCDRSEQTVARRGLTHQIHEIVWTSRSRVHERTCPEGARRGPGSHG